MHNHTYKEFVLWCLHLCNQAMGDFYFVPGFSYNKVFCFFLSLSTGCSICMCGKTFLIIYEANRFYRQIPNMVTVVLSFRWHFIFILCSQHVLHVFTMLYVMLLIPYFFIISLSCSTSCDRRCDNTSVALIQ